MSHYIDIRSLYIWILLWKGQALSYQVVCVLHKIFGERSLLQHRQWNYRQSNLNATSAIPLSFQVLYNLIVFLGKSKIHRICVHFQLFELVYITETGEEVVVQLQKSQFWSLPFEDWRSRNWLALCVQSVLKRVQLHTMNCSHGLAFWTV